MRRYEAAYMLDREFADRTAFNAEVGKFNKIIDGVVAADVLKVQIRQTVRSYADAFEALDRRGRRDHEPRRRHRFRR